VKFGDFWVVCIGISIGTMSNSGIGCDMV